MTDLPAVSRRTLFAGAAAASVALGMQGAEAAAPKRKASPKDLPAENIGAQLYSVADQAKSIGFPKLFTALSTIGYKYVEFAGYGNKDNYSPKVIRKVLADHGLKAIGNHGGMDDSSLTGALQTGQKYTGISVLTNIHGAHTDAWKQTADDLNAYGEKCVKEGLKGFYIHMHGPEYTRVADNPSLHVIDVLLANTDPRYVFWEMDIYWAYFFQGYLDAGGALVDPLQWVLKNPKRFPLFHVKDGKQVVKSNGLQLAAQPEGGLGTFPLQDGICDVGQGDVPFKRFFHELSKVSDLRKHYFLWERDTASQHPHGSLCSARASYEMIAHNRLVDPATAY
ncbi:MAG: sugar phosphate isomerase/epimerase [Actinomycetota bacterium]|nr:sugar phosphate isomerase/epimerase [Actinomycetota bacterium]